MNCVDKPALKAALAIHGQLAGAPCKELPIALPEYSWARIQQLKRQIDLARRHAWHQAVKRLTEDLAGTLECCRSELENYRRRVEMTQPPPRVTSASDLYRDILALSNEFEDMAVDLEEHTVSVTTDRIVLEDIDLGPFEIRLDWRNIGTSTPYRVVAKDPNPAQKSDDITHPHVQDEQLCEGEGRGGIRSALAEGRIYDFFIMVSQVLHTYGRGSAYVELEDWRGSPCGDCGESVDSDDRYYCSACSSILCASCSLSCQQCGESYCSDCLTRCAGCGGDYCPHCLRTCRQCHRSLCEECCPSGLCRFCNPTKPSNEDNDDDPTEEPREEPAAVPAGACVGAALPAV